MTRFFCGMWEYKTQVMNYARIESFLAKLISKKENLYISVCDKNGKAIMGARYNKNNVYIFQNKYCIAGLVLYDTNYKLKIDSLHNVFLVPIH